MKHEKVFTNQNDDFKRNSNSNKTKKIIEHYHKIKTNKSFHIRPSFNMLKDHLKNKNKNYKLLQQNSRTMVILSQTSEL